VEEGERLTKVYAPKPTGICHRAHLAQQQADRTLYGSAGQQSCTVQDNLRKREPRCGKRIIVDSMRAAHRLVGCGQRVREPHGSAYDTRVHVNASARTGQIALSELRFLSQSTKHSLVDAAGADSLDWNG